MKLIILKVQEDSMSGKVTQVTVGFFDKDGICREWKLLSGEMFDQRTKLEKGMELKLVPANSL